MNIKSLAAAGLLMGATACTTNVNYRTADFTGEKINAKKVSARELKEKDVLGLVPGTFSDRHINQILDQASALELEPGSTVLVVQYGATNPEATLLEELSGHFTVVPHTGIASDVASDLGETASQVLRLAAAHSKAEHILVVWGNLEVRRDDLPTEIVSWVPVVDFMVPDQYQKMRMSLKVAVIDVRTGNWSTFTTEPVEHQTITTRYAREHNDKWPMRPIKQKLYRAAVEKLLATYVVAAK
jgi:hypothetical protein